MEDEKNEGITEEKVEAAVTEEPATKEEKSTKKDVPKEKQDVSAIELPTTKIFDKVLSEAGDKLSEDFFNSNSYYLSKYGLLGLYGTAGIGLIISLIMAIKFSSFSLVFGGLGWVVACLVVQYIALKFLPVGESSIESSPSVLSSDAFLKCFSLICFLMGIISLFGMLIIGFKTKALEPMFAGIGLFVFFEYLFCIGLNPGLLNIKIVEDTSAGEEAIGILSFMMKGFLKMIPILFGIGIILGTLNLIISAFRLFGDYPQAAMALITSSGISTLTMASLPLTGFLIFTFYYLTLDVIRSIIEIPKKLK